MLTATATALALLAGASALDPGAVEVVRITRDFGKPHFSLAIDAWPDAPAAALAEARLRWVNTAEDDRRKPLGAFTERLVKLRYRRDSAAALTVTVTGDAKEFAFSIELAPDGAVHAFVAADTAEGRHLPRCRAAAAHLIARRVLGLAVGLDRIDVTCVDDRGHGHPAQIRHRDV